MQVCQGRAPKATRHRLRSGSRVRPARRSFEHVQPERQDAAQPRGMFGVIGIIIAGAGMEKNSQPIAVKHEPRQQ